MARWLTIAVVMMLGCAEKGDPGPKGDKGDPGDPGEAGDEGPTGEEGPSGAVGPRGPEGPRGVDGDDGDQGPEGDEGERGEVGPQGDVGPVGSQGPQGSPGDAGPAGPMGDEGSTGPTGPAGAFEVRDGNGELLGTFLSGDFYGPWWVMTPEGAVVSYHSLYGSFDVPGSGDSALGFASTDCSGQAYAISDGVVGLGVVGAGLTNSNQLYVTRRPRQLGFEIHSRREWNTGLCTGNITESVTVMPVTLIGPKPSSVVLPLELVERE